jgi:hypothetical protein
MIGSVVPQCSVGSNHPTAGIICSECFNPKINFRRLASGFFVRRPFHCSGGGKVICIHLHMRQEQAAPHAIAVKIAIMAAQFSRLTITRNQKHDFAYNFSMTSKRG